jgi:hypothetical protein
MVTKANSSSKEVKSKSGPLTEKKSTKSQSKKPSKQILQRTVESEEIEESPSDLENELLEEGAHNDLVSEDSDDDVSSHPAPSPSDLI